MRFKQNSLTTDYPGQSAQRRSKSQWRGAAAGIVLAVAIFMLGWGVGSGALSLDRLHHHPTAANNLPAQLNYSTVNDVYQSLKENYNGTLTESQLEDGLKHGLAEATKDPYTVYFTPQEAKDFNGELNNSFTGIGAQLGQDSDGNLEVIAPIDGLPAAKAGLKALDLITSINGQSTSGESVDDAVNKIRGPKGTKVTLQIVRNHAQALTFTITRDDINLPSVKSKILDGSIGYMQITTFADDTGKLAQQAADQFKSAHVKGIILDLRENPGGIVDQAVNVSSLWLPAGQTITETKGTNGDQTLTATGNDELYGIPTVVLIDQGSASASEITTGALHDNKAAYVIGQKSYGKGVEQSLINFNDGSQLKVTVASWYRPNGQNINHKGITPDQTVKISDADAKAGTDTQLNAAEAYLSK